ncbi:MAG: hypothetical protein Q4B43_08150 [Bacteroidota bacterium]|nr:hypothetical protein [Bacteroidota bacterium]
MAKQINLKQENYTVVADFIAASFEKDLTDFTAVFKTMDINYLERFKKSINEAKNSVSATEIKMKQKEATKKLYEKSKKLYESIYLLKKYAKRADTDVSMLDDIISNLKKKNIEGAIKLLRDAFPYLMSISNKLVDMPDDFLNRIFPIISKLENLNIEQNILMNESKEKNNERKPIYKNLYKYISEIAEAGKVIYKNSYKKDEYTISKIISRIQN